MIPWYGSIKKSRTDIRQAYYDSDILVQRIFIRIMQPSPHHAAEYVSKLEHQYIQDDKIPVF